MGSARCAVLLPLIAAGIRILGFRRVGAMMARSARPYPAARADNRWRVARRLQRQVENAARFGPYPARCLERSLLLWWLLGRRGVETRLRLGVRRQGEGMKAHAWVELDGRALEARAAGDPRHEPFDRDFAPDNPHA